ncbi:DNA-binding transcriptional LysR family regulator [Rhizobium leguminosarum]|uniref:HTH-type transcriptional regulator TtuA n=3 Tax=Rhizobium TaxID=379 RepID=A0A7W6ZWF6_9HYPH|nr:MULTISPECIES: LysR family transcriptional regulator [Rhizobium]MBB4570037.1 DNA-binding transcriptional LysR family regulator [Rhizobium leucaenae]MDK4716202.1 LysR family transcriptional regulator [Rhizobium sp. CNPSo 4039]MDK4721965.1 LysR family transcriptional regulator [Rhizobium sp. CNPSo 3968]NYJ14666.1 DNA-binding transcriptional LysR family regulator [Rhizobium leguminosarum]SCB38841.1 transcriptional regulator, LysR family [Rhizobium lusitanum]
MVSTRADLADLETFVAIARAGGFRKAAALRGVSGSALSHSIRGLEARLGVRLFHRTSRSISLTAAGEVLLAELEPHFLGIQAAMDLLDSFRSGPTGRVRVTTLRDAAELLIAPRLHSFRRNYPDVEIEVSVEDRFIDMVAEGFDAGIRYGGTVPEGMIASRLTSELEWVVVGSPTYLNERGRPERPEDLLTHECIRIRTGTDHVCKWELGDGDRMVALDVPGLLTLGDSELSIRMAQEGGGLFYCLRARVEDKLAAGLLEVVLPDWSSTGPGFHAYYVSHRQVPSALRTFLDHLKAPLSDD